MPDFGVECLVIDRISNKASYALISGHKCEVRQFEQFVPVRLTSLIEVTVRHYLRKMTNSGGDFLTGGLELLGQRNIKDVTHALRAVQEKQLTVGDIVSNTQSANSVEEIIAALERV